MGIKKVFKAISTYLVKEKMDYALIGAFALYSYDYIRATQDIDFITRSENKNKIIAFLESIGFETTFSSGAFSNHFHPIGSARVDVMYVDGTTADEIFNSTSNRLIFDDLELPVVRAEHLVAMKLFAIQNNPERKFRDLADIKEILQRVSYDKNLVQAYFKKYGQYAYFNEITGEASDEK